MPHPNEMISLPPAIDAVDVAAVAVAVTATALAVAAFALAYIAKTLREWWTWRK